MKKFIIFFLLSFYLYPENTEKIFNYLKYLSQKKIIENIPLNENESLDKKEFLKILYKSLKFIDKEKISKEDLKIIESMLFEIVSFINKFKEEASFNNQEIINFKKEILEQKQEFYNQINKNLSKIDFLEKFLKDNFEMENNLKNFFRRYKINLQGDLGFFNQIENFDYLKTSCNLYAKVSKKNNYFKLFYEKESDKNKHLLIKSNLFFLQNTSFYAKNYFSSFISHFNEIFYSNYLDYNNIIGIKNKNTFDFCIFHYKNLKDINNLNIINILNLKYFSFASYFDFSKEFKIKNNFLEIGIKFPFFYERIHLSLGVTLENSNKLFGNFHIGYSSTSFNLHLFYKDNLDNINGVRKLKVNTNFIIYGEIYIGGRAHIDFLNIKNVEIEDMIEQWECFIKTKNSIFNLNLSLNSKKVGTKDTIFGFLKSEVNYLKYKFKIGIILKDPIEKTALNKFYKLCLFARVEYYIFEELNLYIQYLKSNFEYKNDEINLEGKKYNILFNDVRKIIDKNDYGTFSLGFSFNI